MATINQTWDEPYAAIKEQADILCEKYPSNIKRTYGGIAIDGCFKMLDQYPTEGPEQLRCWELFGDPNMHVYTSTPIALTITHPINVDTGVQNITISGTDKATVCLYSKKLGIQKVLDLSSGKAVFSIPVSGNDGDTIYVTGTMYNHVTYEGLMVIQTGTTHSSIDYVASIKTFAVSITGSHLNYQIPENIGEKRGVAVVVKLFTPQGKLISVVTDVNKGPGKYSMALAKDNKQLAKGTYLSSIKAGNFKKVMKVVLK
jgi:gingipain R